MSIDVIVIGAPRSGTYWVVDILNSHFGISFPSETHFIPIFKRYSFLFGNLKRHNNRRRLLRAILQFIQLWTPRSGSSEDYIKGIREFSLLSVYDSGKQDWIIANSSDYESLIACLFEAFKDLKSANHVGDKSAHFFPKPSVKTLDLCPSAKVLHIVRDGRDVAESWKKQWFGPDNYFSAGVIWKSHENHYDNWGATHKDRYLKISYEDLALKKTDVLNSIRHFIGSNYQFSVEPVSSNTMSEVLSQIDSHAKIITMKADDNLSKWRSANLTSVGQFESVAIQSLEKNQYEMSSAGSSFSRLKYFYGWIRLFVNLHFYKVIIKNNLPPVIWLMNFLGIPVESILNRKFPDIWKQPIKL